MASIKIKFIVIVTCLIAICPWQGLSTAAEPDTSGEILKFDFREVNLSDVLMLLSREMGVNIVAGEDVTGNVSGHFEGTAEETLNAVIKAAGNFSLVKEKDFLRVIPSDKAEEKYLVTKVVTLEYIDAEDLEDIIREMLSPLGKLKIFSKKYRGEIRGSGASTTGIGTTTGTGTTSGTTTGTSGGFGRAIDIGKEGLMKSDTLLITDIPSNIERIEDIIRQLDMMPPQVMIESRILDVTRSKGKHWGIQAEYRDDGTAPDDHSIDILQSLLPSAEDLTEGFIGFSVGTLTRDEYNVVMETLETQANANLLSAPRLVTLDNQPAKIVVVTQEPTITQSVTTATTTTTGTGGVVVASPTYSWGADILYGIVLEVIPRISKNGYITMRIYPQVSGKTGEIASPPSEGTGGAPVIGSKPIIRVKEMLTQALVKSGDTVVIGGLIEDEETSEVAKVPILGDIPLLGLPFRRTKKIEEKKELLIFLTPTIIKEMEPASSAHAAPVVHPGRNLPVLPPLEHSPAIEPPEDVSGEIPSLPQEVPAKPMPSQELLQALGEPMSNPVDRPSYPLKEGSSETVPAETVVQTAPVQPVLPDIAVQPEPEPVLQPEPVVQTENEQSPEPVVISPEPEKSKSAYLLAMAYIGESKYKEAQIELEKAVELDPANEDAKRFLKNLKAWMNVLE